jgi:hypothetical protein
VQLALEKFEERVGPVAVDVNLGKEVKLGSLPPGKLLDLLVGSGLLRPKLVAWEGQDP